jgi:hypothetical protein
MNCDGDAVLEHDNQRDMNPTLNGD